MNKKISSNKLDFEDNFYICAKKKTPNNNVNCFNTVKPVQAKSPWDDILCSE